MFHNHGHNNRNKNNKNWKKKLRITPYSYLKLTLYCCRSPSVCSRRFFFSCSHARDIVLFSHCIFQMQFSNNNFCSIKLKWAVRTAVLDGIGIVVNPNFMWLLQCCTSRGWVFDAHSPRSFAIIPMQWHTRFEYDGQWWRCGLALSSTTTLTLWKWVYFCRPIFHQNHLDKTNTNDIIKWLQNLISSQLTDLNYVPFSQSVLPFINICQ